MRSPGNGAPCRHANAAEVSYGQTPGEAPESGSRRAPARSEGVGHDQVDETLELVGLTAIAESRTQKLSGGQLQRVRFALALISDPEVLILDEPTVGMNVEARRSYWVSVRSFAARGKTVIFATRYLEEADAYADRVVLMAHGRVVADGPPGEIRGRVGRRTIRATLPDADPSALSSLPGVAAADRRGEAIVLMCSDSDAAIRALLDAYPAARDIEIAGAGLEEAFVQLTGDRQATGAVGGRPEARV